MLALLLGLALGGLIVGALARLAVPGPDPMPIWTTIAIGLAGSFTGGIVGRLLFGPTGGFLLGFAAAVALVIGYRRVVHGRGITGPSGRSLRR
jgi:uncharacterized membrane protein YeaQ/YmgE (transglycosylase-associated protein family)